MANKQINELTGKTAILKDDDYLLVYDSEEAGSEQTKKVPISSNIAVVASNITINVATTGSDVTGDGSSGSPFGSLQGAIDWLDNKHINAQRKVEIKLADGTYNSQPNFVFENLNRVDIIGNTTTPSNVTLNFITGIGGLRFEKSGYCFIRGMVLNGFEKSEWHVGLVCRWGTTLYVRDVTCDNWGIGFQSYYDAYMLLQNCTSNNNQYGLQAAQQAKITMISGTVTNCVDIGVASELSGRVNYDTSEVSMSGNGTNNYTNTGGSINTY